jgi:hypothetical protein
MMTKRSLGAAGLVEFTHDFLGVGGEIGWKIEYYYEVLR